MSIIIDTPIHHSVRGLIGDEIFDAGLKQGIYTRRFGRTERIAQAILFLYSDQGGYIAGTALTPEGGLTWRI